MTTEVQRQKGVPAHEYADHVDRILAPRPRPPRLGFLSLPALPALFALWLWPGWVLTLALLGAAGLLAWFLWSARQVSREHDEEQNLG